MGRLLTICAGLVSCVVSVQVNDLIVFFSSPNGLALDFSAASQLANNHAGNLTACGVTVPKLQALRDTMILPGKLDLDLVAVRKMLLVLAYQHVDPADLSSLYVTLRTGLFWSIADAQNSAMSLSMQHTQTELPLPLFQFFKSLFPTQQAALTATQIASAGADPATLKSVYSSSRSKGMSQDAALNTALTAAVVANLYGAPGRYGKDGQMYAAKDFQQYYPGMKWLDEWIAAPQEKRTAADGRDYRASEFSQHYGAGWITQWNDSPIAELRRIADDSMVYTLSEFVDHYKDSWQVKWSQAKEVMDVCAGLTQQTCNAQWKCQWWWSGDPTTSCVVRPRSEKKVSSVLV